MKNKAYVMAILYLFLSVSGSLYGAAEKTIKLGGGSGWAMAERRTGIAEVGFVRPVPVLVLASSSGTAAAAPDLSLSFDEGHASLFRDSAGHYRVTVSPNMEAVDRRYALAGYGAALFPVMHDSSSGKAKSGGSLIIDVQSRNALFAPSSRFGDFSMEFWLNPINLENGEQVLLWTSIRPSDGSSSDSQRIQCSSSKNRLQWSFSNFFISPDGAKSTDINFTGSSAIVPKTWSHHLVRFDSVTGLVEYMVNGNSESIVYATSTGREGGEVYTPVAGEGGSFILGRDFGGLMDEFRIHGSYAPGPALNKYPLPGGRIETGAIDLGAGSNGIVKVDACGGVTSMPITGGRQASVLSSEYMRNGRFLFSDSSEMQFFIRSSDNAFLWKTPWLPVTPGTDITGSVQGRYVQLAVDFYPSSGGKASPYLEELRITYIPDEPPLPPAQITAVAMDGSVQLYWKNSPDQNAQGYLIYYGTSSDDYFGEEAALGPSPISVGKINSINIDGLQNGVLYYFRIAAYSRYNAASFHAGEFSREVVARPLRGLNSLF